MTLADKYPGSEGFALLRRLPTAATRSEVCACGGIVRGDPRFPIAVVSRHNGTAAHRAWRERTGR